MYKPNPIDTSNIELPGDINDLIELMAKNVHEVWAQQRLSNGWKYGNKRDDSEKKHPCLVAYEELDESEKKIDKTSVEQIIKCILKLGYEIKKKDE